MRIEVLPPPQGLENMYNKIFTDELKDFLYSLITRFSTDVNQLFLEREQRRLELRRTGTLPDFSSSVITEDKTWRISPLPERLLCRNIDLGDVSPSDTERFQSSLLQAVDGVQVDFDDGHCPTWRNQIQGWYNIYAQVHGLSGDTGLETGPIMMLRPRAWNMTEHNIFVGGQVVPGPLVDFGILMFHCGQKLAAKGAGPFFYLSKLEDAREAALWNRIFLYTQESLGLALGTIKACVLIENILAAFQLDHILWELRDHSLGLNCGIWDYCASIINIFGTRADAIIPDRKKYVNMEKHFMKSYLNLVVKTCRSRGAPATGGMAAAVFSSGISDEEVLSKTAAVVESKRSEILAGVSGFLIYDFNLIQPIRSLWKSTCVSPTIHQEKEHLNIASVDLLTLPAGGVTMEGLKLNIAVGVLFINGWLGGRGTFVYKGGVEDSATAEISRMQVWQWLRHEVPIENSILPVTRSLVLGLLEEDTSLGSCEVAKKIFLDVVLAGKPPEFITTYLNDIYCR